MALPRLEPARERTVVLLGHEWHGVPDEHVEAADICVEIPMIGQGASLNVAVPGASSFTDWRAWPDPGDQTRS